MSKLKFAIASSVAAILVVGGVGITQAHAAPKAKTYNRGDAQFCADKLGRNHLSKAKGSRGDCVGVLQQALKALGAKNLNVDTIFGTKTDQALRAYEKSKGWNPDGEADGSFSNGGLFKYFLALDNTRKANQKIFKPGKATIKSVGTIKKKSSSMNSNGNSNSSGRSSGSSSSGSGRSGGSSSSPRTTQSKPSGHPSQRIKPGVKPKAAESNGDKPLNQSQINQTKKSTPRIYGPKASEIKRCPPDVYCPF